MADNTSAMNFDADSDGDGDGDRLDGDGDSEMPDSDANRNMTFDAQGNIVDVLGNIVVPDFAVQQYRYGMQQQQQQQRQVSRSPGK